LLEFYIQEDICSIEGVEIKFVDIFRTDKGENKPLCINRRWGTKALC